MSTLNDSLQKAEGDQRPALQWFLDHEGDVVPWPSPMPSGLFLANKAKGIHKPANWDHALSVRQSLGGPYDDREVEVSADGSWRFDYFQEGKDPSRRDDDYTNRALLRNMQDGMPVGVLIQVKKKPDPRYKVLGLAQVSSWAGGYFRLDGFTPAGEVVRAAGDSPTDGHGKTSKGFAVGRSAAGGFRHRRRKKPAERSLLRHYWEPLPNGKQPRRSNSRP